ncbi:PREDICTED: uncharacterized protein LOC107331837 [Acropora digitifera]|uniref:uncharacterized protein LOC107331837 n=1 Tax=Acropora digitifera TaxID=70779 RepID=UPI00077A53C5|nr:PREDICTED: uncharacterized protein LOC107331837 [Acropora digitifera]
MPFFKKSSKPPKRRLDAGNTTLSKSNLSLSGTGEVGDSINNALVKLKLGRHELMFQDGEWIAGQGFNYFIFLLQMAASTADCNVMDKELDALKSQKQFHKVAR